MEGSAPFDPAPFKAADVAAAFDWWRGAGVDLAFTDDPANWLPSDKPDAPPPPVFAVPNQQPAETQGPASLGDDRAEWPKDISAFREWWLTEPSLDDGQVRDRVSPRGPTGAKVMVIVPQPESADRAELLSGPEGRLLDAMLAAMGIAREDAYLASALPRHTPLADWATLASRGLGSLLAHHIGLAAPQRLIVFGSSISPLLGNDPAQNAAFSATFNHEGLIIPLLGTQELGALMARPRWKAGFWQRWLDWTGSENA